MHAHAQGHKPAAPERQQRTDPPRVQFVCEPSITVTPDGLSLEVTLVTFGDHSLSVSIDARLADGTPITLSEPQITLSVADGATSISFPLPPTAGLTEGAELLVYVHDPTGTVLATAVTSPNGAAGPADGGAASTLVTKVVLGGLATATVAAAVLIVADPLGPVPPSGAPTPAVTTTASPDAEPGAVTVTFPSSLTLTPAVLDDDRSYPLGMPASVQVDLGPEVSGTEEDAAEYYGVDGGEVASRQVMVTYGGRSVDVGPVVLPTVVPASVAQSGLHAATVGVAERSLEADELVPVGTGVSDFCYEEGTGEVIGGFVTTEGGAIAIEFAIEGGPSSPTPVVSAFWQGGMELRVIRASANRDLQVCLEESDGVLQWD